ncbi:hypothetical protein SAMN05421507_1011498 [Lentzea jiangxiensis]|uniref:Uncharacterized protein n=1 Tax=Lentzea jiangxiensis TaxID=641025 RepID=A0A1H0H3R2_9PSEU|nr:hypothetical protein SAMN05421507_1011498 [Lentzea jiangxiensis]
MLLGVILAANPAAGAMACVITIGVFAILWGVMPFSLRSKQLDGGPARPSQRV